MQFGPPSKQQVFENTCRQAIGESGLKKDTINRARPFLGYYVKFEDQVSLLDACLSPDEWLSTTDKDPLLDCIILDGLNDMSWIYGSKPTGRWFSRGDWSFHDMMMCPPKYKIKINYDHILVLSSRYDLSVFNQNYGIFSSLQTISKSINWSKVYQKYDGIVVMLDFQATYNNLVGSAYWLQGWDVSSLVIWRPKNVILQSKKLQFNKQDIAFFKTDPPVVSEQFLMNVKGKKPKSPWKH